MFKMIQSLTPSLYNQNTFDAHFLRDMRKARCSISAFVVYELPERHSFRKLMMSFFEYSIAPTLLNFHPPSTLFL